MPATTPRPPSSEQVAAFDRNAWSRSIGISGRNPRNPHRPVQVCPFPTRAAFQRSRRGSAARDDLVARKPGTGQIRAPERRRAGRARELAQEFALVFIGRRRTCRRFRDRPRRPERSAHDDLRGISPQRATHRRPARWKSVVEPSIWRRRKSLPGISRRQLGRKPDSNVFIAAIKSTGLSSRSLSACSTKPESRPFISSGAFSSRLAPCIIEFDATPRRFSPLAVLEIFCSVVH